MPFRIRFLDFPTRAPLDGLLAHYEPIAKGLHVLEEALNGYLHAGPSRAFKVLLAEMDTLENEADKLKRKIRNHLPPALFTIVDKSLLLAATSRQDDIMDASHEALLWLAMRAVEIPESVRPGLRDVLAQAVGTVTLLKPALTAITRLVCGEPQDRREAKECIHAVREQHRTVARARFRLAQDIYALDADFRDVYQIMHFLDSLHDASHSAEACADFLRAMIARQD